MRHEYWLAIRVLENEAKRHRHDVFRGRHIYGDPEEELQRFESMAEDLEKAAAVLKVIGK